MPCCHCELRSFLLAQFEHEDHVTKHHMAAHVHCLLHVTFSVSRRASVYRTICGPCTALLLMHCPVVRSLPSKEPSGRPASKCPFRDVQPASIDDVAAAHSGGNGKSTALDTGSRPSPEAVSALNGCPSGYATSEPAREPLAAAARCSLGHGQQQINTRNSVEQGSAPAQCPMGFTAADGPRMTQLHCVICKSLLYDCVQLSCTCKYCRYCVASFQDCPLCGADITSRTAEPKLQGARSSTSRA